MAVLEMLGAQPCHWAWLGKGEKRLSGEREEGREDERGKKVEREEGKKKKRLT